MRERLAWYWDKRGVRGERKESELVETGVEREGGYSRPAGVA